MGRGQKWVEMLVGTGSQLEDSLGILPLVEVAGDRRVFVEHHQGVVQYSKEIVSIRVRYGILTIHGSGLELRHMSRTQLAVAGAINSITLERRS